MLSHLLYLLHDYISPFNVFQYITFRTACASLTALLFCLLSGPWFISKLRQFQVGQQIREDGPQSHQGKAGTPTMGGVMIVAAILVATFLWGDIGNYYILIAMLSLLAFAAIGFADDYLKLSRKNSKGLSAKKKIFFQVLIGAGIFTALVWLSQYGLYSTRLSVPFFKLYTPDLNWTILGYSTFIPLFLFLVFIIVASSNTVNLTDGLDGLAAGCIIVAASSLTILTYVTGHAQLATYLGLIKNSYAAELTVFTGAVVGATLGFLWYNAHPAELFMGDVGALSLGGAIGTVAVIIKQELLLPLIGGIFVLEGLSVILQVGSFRFLKRRIFKMAPLHHHFELLGWDETKVVIRFWIAALIFALFSLSTLKLR